MATAKKLPSGAWRALVYSHTEFIPQQDGGIKKVRRYESFTAETKKEAEYQAAKFALDKKRASKASHFTVGEAIDQYIESKTNVLSPATIREYRRSRAHDLAPLMPVPLKNLNPSMIQAAINQEAASHSPKTVRNIHGLLSATLAMFLPDFKLTTRLPEPRKTEIHVPTDLEIQKLVQGIQGSKIEIPVLLAAFGSLRRSEVCALTYEDVEGNTIRVNKAMVKDENKNWVIKGTKRIASTRTVVLPAFLTGKIGSGSGLVADVTPDYITKTFSKELRRLGIPHFRFHDLRHYQASILHALGVPDKYIVARGGWQSESTLKKIYQHTMSDKEKQFTNLANSHFQHLYCSVPLDPTKKNTQHATQNATQK